MDEWTGVSAMKRGLIWLMVVLLGLSCLVGQAEGIRHQVTGDISTFEVEPEAGLSQAEPNEAGNEASLGTDAYLFVDPDSASYVTFYVTDEAGNPIQGAQIYITYNGITELYGVTGADGRYSMYLFRNVEYGYRVTKTGYESASGTFTATQETKVVHVVLRKLYDFTVIIVDNDEPVPGVTVIIDGERYITDENGRVTVQKPNGEYDVIVETPDGRRLPVKAVVRGDTVIVVDIGLDDTIAKGGVGRDRFLVYDKHYDPEDYVLTKYLFTKADLARSEEETEEVFAQRVQRYLQENVSTVLVEAQPERVQHENAPDEDIFTPSGEELYAQRSMMPTGFVLRAWEEEGYDQVTFTNEDMGLMVEQDTMHSGEMMKVWAILQAMTDFGMDIEEIATEETLKAENGLRDAGLTALDGNRVELSSVDLNAVRAFEFDFDHVEDALEHEDCALLLGTMYTNALFEFRITPIQPEALNEMVTDGLRDELALQRDEIMLASPAYFREALRAWQADGRLTETECAELYAFVIDGRLEAEEIEQLRERMESGELSRDSVELLLEAALAGKVYRAQIFVHYEGVSVNITTLLEPKVLWDANAHFAEEYARQERLSAENGEEITQEELVRRTEEALAAQIDLVRVDNEGRDVGEENYTPGENTARLPVTLMNAAVDANGEFAQTLMDKNFRQWTVDVRLEQMQNSGEQMPVYRAYFEEGETQLPAGADYRFEAESPISGLYAPAWLEQALGQ